MNSAVSNAFAAHREERQRSTASEPGLQRLRHARAQFAGHAGGGLLHPQHHRGDDRDRDQRRDAGDGFGTQIGHRVGAVLDHQEHAERHRDRRRHAEPHPLERVATLRSSPGTRPGSSPRSPASSPSRRPIRPLPSSWDDGVGAAAVHAAVRSATCHVMRCPHSTALAGQSYVWLTLASREFGGIGPLVARRSRRRLAGIASGTMRPSKSTGEESGARRCVGCGLSPCWRRLRC